MGSDKTALLRARTAHYELRQRAPAFVAVIVCFSWSHRHTQLYLRRKLAFPQSLQQRSRHFSHRRPIIGGAFWRCPTCLRCAGIAGERQATPLFPRRRPAPPPDSRCHAAVPSLVGHKRGSLTACLSLLLPSPLASRSAPAQLTTLLCSLQSPLSARPPRSVHSLRLLLPASR